MMMWKFCPGFPLSSTAGVGTGAVATMNWPCFVVAGAIVGTVAGWRETGWVTVAAVAPTPGAGDVTTPWVVAALVTWTEGLGLLAETVGCDGVVETDKLVAFPSLDIKALAFWISFRKFCMTSVKELSRFDPLSISLLALACSNRFSAAESSSNSTSFLMMSLVILLLSFCFKQSMPTLQLWYLFAVTHMISVVKTMKIIFPQSLVSFITNWVKKNSVFPSSKA